MEGTMLYSQWLPTFHLLPCALEWMFQTLYEGHAVIWRRLVGRVLVVGVHTVGHLCSAVWQSLIVLEQRCVIIRTVRGRRSRSTTTTQISCFVQSRRYLIACVRRKGCRVCPGALAGLGTGRATEVSEWVGCIGAAASSVTVGRSFCPSIPLSYLCSSLTGSECEECNA